MRSDTEGLLHILTTRGAFLRSVVRCHGNHLATSIFGFVLKKLTEHSPGCIGYSKSQRMVTYHVGWLQVFNSDSLIVLDVVMRSFMQRILALVRNALVMTRNIVFSFLASGAALLALCEFALCSCQFLSTLLGMFGIVDDMPVAIRYQIADTHIQPYSIIFLRQWLLLSFTDALQI